MCAGWRFQLPSRCPAPPLPARRAPSPPLTADCPATSSCSPYRRDIDKAGGIDAYILNTPDKKLQSDVAMELRAKMLSAMARQAAPPRGLQTLLPRAAAAAAAEPAP